MADDPFCTVAGCPREIRAAGLCGLHQRRKIAGEPLNKPHDQIGTTPSGFGLLGIVDRDDDSVLCHECGETFRALASHLRHAHDMATRAYRQRHQLPSSIPLTSLSASRKIAATSQARVGTAGWKRFERRRDEVNPQARLLGAQASRESTDGTKAQRAQRAVSQFSRPHLDNPRWEERFAAALAFMKNHGRPPSRRAAAADERTLARWMGAQREAHRRGSLTDIRRRKLESAGFDLDPGRGVRWWPS